MKCSLLFCLVLIGGVACHKSGTSGASGLPDYDSLILIGANRFTTSLMQPMAAAAAGNQIVFGAGEIGFGNSSDSVFIFDAGTNQWAEAKTSSGHSSGCMTAVDSQIVLAGGVGSPADIYSSNVDIYAPSSGKWTTASLSQGRLYLAAASAGSIAAFGGGQTASLEAVATVDLYNASTGKWSASALSSPRFGLAAAGVGTTIVFAGGIVNSNQYSDVVDIYDTRSSLWTTAHLSVARALITTAVIGNQLIFAGGYNSNGISDAVEIYDVSTGQWSAGHLREPCYYYAGATSSGNLALFLATTTTALTDTVDIYNANTRSWTSAAVLPGDRSTRCGAAVGNQLITMSDRESQPTTAYYYQLK
jgi:hypothetical protein